MTIAQTFSNKQQSSVKVGTAFVLSAKIMAQGFMMSRKPRHTFLVSWKQKQTPLVSRKPRQTSLGIHLLRTLLVKLTSMKWCSIMTRHSLHCHHHLRAHASCRCRQYRALPQWPVQNTLKRAQIKSSSPLMALSEKLENLFNQTTNVMAPHPQVSHSYNTSK